MSEDSIIFTTDEGEEVSLYVIGQTALAGDSFLLVTDSQEDEAEAFILKEVDDEEHQIIYETVEDEGLMMALSKLFEELLTDVDIQRDR